MRRLIGFVLLLAGLVWCGWHAFQAISAFGGLYSSTLSDPLSGPPGGEKAVSDAMISNVIRGAFGLPVLILGSYLLRRGRRMKIRL